jgi:outer membrane autotransporter protein
MTNLKKLLLTGTAVVAIGAVGTAATFSPAFAAGEFSADSNNDGTFDLAGDDTDDIDTDFDANGHDVQYVPAAAGDSNALRIDDVALSIGSEAAAATNAALVLADSKSGSTITFSQLNADEVTFTFNGTTDGAISRGTNAAFNVNLIGNTAGQDHAGLYDINGDVDLGTGTLDIASANVDNETGARIDGDVTAGAIVIDGLPADTLLIFDGTENQTVSGTINGDTDGDGNLVVANTEGKTVTFNSNIGTSATAALGVLTVGGAAITVDTVNYSVLGGGAATFNGTLFVDTINIGGTDTGNEDVTVTFNGDVTSQTAVEVDEDAGSTNGTVVTFADDATFTGGLDIATEADVVFKGVNKTVTGAIDANANTEGNVIVGDGTNEANVTFVGSIGANDELDSFTVAANATATLQGDLDTTSQGNAIDGLDVEGTLIIDADAAGRTVGTSDTGDVDINGTVSVTGDNTSSIVSADDIFLDGVLTTALTNSAVLNLTGTDNAADIQISQTADATINAGNQIVTTGDVLIGTTGRVTTLNINKTAAFAPEDIATGVINATGDTVTVATDGTFRVALGTGTAGYDDGDTILVINSDEAATTNYATAITNGDIVLVDTALIDIRDNGSDANDLNVILDFRNASDAFTNTTYAGAANALIGQGSGSVTGNLSTIRTNLLTANTSGAEDIAESISPTVDGGASVTVATNVTGNSNGLVGERLASVRQSDQTGMAAGNLTHGLKVWGQVFGSTGDQDQRDGIAGYDVDTLGATVGIDTQTLVEDWVWGLAFTYADSDVDSKGVNSTDADIDSYQIALYGDYNWDGATYVNGVAGYGWNDIDQTRYNVGTISGVNANSDYDADQFFAKLETGRDYEFDNGTTLTPFALLNFNYLDTDSYTETGAGTANLTVDTDEQYIFEAGVGVEASWLHQLDDGSYLKPELRAAYRYDFADDEVETTSSFQGAPGVTFNTNGFDPQQHTFRLGAGLSFFTTANWDIALDYDYELKEDYDAHNGLIRAAYKF